MSVTIRSKHLTRGWGAEFAYLVSKGCNIGEHYVADLVRRSELFPSGWTKFNRRERMFRTFYQNPVQVGDRVFELIKQEPDTNGRTQVLVVVAGTLKPLPSITYYDFTPPETSHRLVPHTRAEMCSRCHWWNAMWHVEHGDFGECRVKAPVREIVNPIHRGAWMMTGAEDWCGEFREYKS